jgi:hypothetical protein
MDEVDEIVDKLPPPGEGGSEPAEDEYSPKQEMAAAVAKAAGVKPASMPAFAAALEDFVKSCVGPGDYGE